MLGWISIQAKSTRPPIRAQPCGLWRSTRRPAQGAPNYLDAWARARTAATTPEARRPAVGDASSPHHPHEADDKNKPPWNWLSDRTRQTHPLGPSGLGLSCLKERRVHQNDGVGRTRDARMPRPKAPSRTRCGRRLGMIRGGAMASSQAQATRRPQPASTMPAVSISIGSALRSRPSSLARKQGGAVGNPGRVVECD